MKKRNTAIRALSVFLAYAMVCTSVPAAGQEMFGSGVNRETEENTSDLKEFQSSQADEFGTDTGSDAELFGSDDAKQEFQDGENSEEGTDGIRYIKGRPLTEEERKEELEPFKNLKPLDPGIEVESDLTSVYAAYGSRETAFPSSYDSRKEGLVTSVKNQNPFGTCWAFGMAAIMETSLLAQNKGTYDLSEEHLSYFFSNRQNDPLENTPDDVNSVLGDYHEIGGNDYLAAIYLSTWSGMTTEDDVPFPTDSLHQQNLSVQIPESKAYNSVAYLKNASFSKYSEERMKEMLLNDHAVSIMLYMKDNYANPDTAAYCYPVGKSSSTVINHIVTVVGWDDNYSKNNFLPVSNVTSDGAWIIKNSWGENKGDGGYYYLSYQDPNISNLVSAEAVTVSDQKYNNNYFYDGSSAISSIKVQPGQSVSVVYETKAGNGNEEALGEINVVTMNDNASYKIQVYTDLTDLSDPESGTAAYTQPCEVEQPVAGVQTVTVPEVMLKQGSRYSVVITNSGISYISFGVEANKFEDAIEQLGLLLGYKSQRPDKTIKKGPDNLWGMGNNSFIMIECKSEVSQGRNSIHKSEVGQMNNHCGWFESEYDDAKVLRIMIIPTINVAYDADFTHEVRVMRKNKLNLLKKNVMNFFKEFKKYDLNNLTENFINQCLEAHDLSDFKIVNNYVENTKKLER